MPMSEYHSSLGFGYGFDLFLCRFPDESDLKWLEICFNVDDLCRLIKFRFSRQTIAFDS